MEKVKIDYNPKIEVFNNKEKIGDKIDSLRSEKLSDNKSTKYETKKLMKKLETSGKEKRKILLKLESGSPRVNSNNYTLISELLKEFFNGVNPIE
ncbi:MAG: hypothetical protein ACFFG0_44965 [Candidatus Thorarchaeota archaeon]